MGIFHPQKSIRTEIEKSSTHNCLFSPIDFPIFDSLLLLENLLFWSHLTNGSKTTSSQRCIRYILQLCFSWMIFFHYNFETMKNNESGKKVKFYIHILQKKVYHNILAPICLWKNESFLILNIQSNPKQQQQNKRSEILNSKTSRNQVQNYNFFVFCCQRQVTIWRFNW